MRFDVNQVLQLYLGAGADGGYQPIGCDERLRQAFPNDYSAAKAAIARYLDETHEPDWARRSLAAETRRFITALEQKFPELEGISVKALANRWSYDWK